MKANFKYTLVTFAVFSIFSSCSEKVKENHKDDLASIEELPPATPIQKRQLSTAFKKYWYAGKAEITSYALEQARYGELRNGKAVLIYVTEPFSADKQVKADQNASSNISVLKLNSTKKFLTGIYPYSIMNSSFYPVHDNSHAIKVTTSMQEWCGHVFTQLNNKDNFEIDSYSYFESEGDKNFKLDKAILENELWNRIRINPFGLPIGEINVIPSFEYLRLAHKELKSYRTTASLTKTDLISSYTIEYPELERTLTINFSTDFPHSIESWTETMKSGFGANAKIMTSKGTKIKTLKTAYWGENRNSDLFLRDSLGL